MQQHKGLRERLYAAVGILLIVLLLISIWQLGGYLIDGWKSKTFSKDLQESIIVDDRKEPEKEMTDKKHENESDEQESQGRMPEIRQEKKQLGSILEAMKKMLKKDLQMH